MTFDALIQRLRLAGLFLLGAALPLAALLGLIPLGLLLLVASAYGGGAAALLVGGFLVVNGLYGVALAFKSFPLPVGRKADAEEAPSLAAHLEELADGWNGPRTKEITFDTGFWSLDLVGVPTLGMLGWTRFRWLMGIYPALALSAREFETLASWELVWWSDQQGWLNLQAKRLAAYWHRLGKSLAPAEEEGKTPWRHTLLAAYARWVRKRFDAFILQEFLAADRAIANHYGAPILARALCRLAILQPLLHQRLFTEWTERIRAGEPLPDDLYGAVSGLLSRWPETAEDLLTMALDGLTAEAPPMLSIRLEQLGEAPRVPLPPERTARVEFLDDSPLLREFEEDWRAYLDDYARETREKQDKRRKRFEELTERLGADFPRHPDAREWLFLAFDFGDADAFGTQITAFLDAEPNDGQARILAYRHALRTGEAPTAGDFDTLFRDYPFLRSELHWADHEHHKRSGDAAAADRAWTLARRADREQEQGLAERRTVTLKDAFEPHGCPESTLEPIRAWLADRPRIREAFLVRKDVEYLPETPALLLIARWRAPFWDPQNHKRREFQNELAQSCPFPPQVFGFVLVTTRPGLWRIRKQLRELNAKLR